jgi:outer membrane immunogenic protein
MRSSHTYKGFLLATAGGLGTIGSAQSADLPLKAAPAYLPPAPVWSGWYIGLHAGGAWQHSDVSTLTGYGNGGYSGAGFIGGGQIGYNWQKGNLVLGLEGDISGLSGGANGFATSDGTPGKNISAKIRWLSTIRGRMGLAVNDTMAYVTAGVAIGGVKNSLLNVANGLAKSVSKTRVGWAVGGGIEHMWSRNWTIGLEAMFVDLGHSRATFDDAKTTRFSNQAIIGRLKLNYKF